VLDWQRMDPATSDSLYRRLQRHLDRMPVGFPATKSGVEIRILKQLFTPDEAAIALELSAIPEAFPIIHKRLRSRLTAEELRPQLDEMAAKGIILAIPVKGKMHYAKLIYAIGMYERQVRRLTPELERDSRAYMEEGFGEAFHTTKTTQLRIVPVNKRIDVQREVATCDQIREHVKSSPGPFATIPCICRHGRDLLGESCKQTKLRDNCLMIGMAAQWAVSSGIGRAVSRDAMLDLLDRAEREGLVLQPENTQSPMFVCCCCHCCCGVLGSAKRFPAPAEYFSSNFHAAVDAGTCGGCGACITRCQMEAITSPDGVAVVDLARCIGCGLCLTDCPSDSMQLEPNDKQRVPPSDTRELYIKMLRDRFGPLGMAKMGARTFFRMKV
jgi:Na+-translocating ferredoxin:NAD+ oxidoreductase subunit B